VRAVDLAVYADVLAGEAGAVAARAERSRARLREAAIERRARAELDPSAVAELESIGLLRPIDERAARAELRMHEEALAALETLQAWVEAELAEASAA
jgi:hypothetical protein